MKLLKKKILIAVIMCLTVLAGAFYFVAPTNRVSANDNYSLLITKVDLQYTNNQIQYNPDGNVQERTDYSPQVLFDSKSSDPSNIEVAMLLNSTPIEANNTTYRQYIKVAFEANAGEELQFLEVNATLNGIAIDTNEKTGENESTNRTYIQYFDLTDIKLLKDGTPIDISEAQGLFKFVFSYMAKLSDGSTTPKNTVEASFYALDQNSYKNQNETSIVEPRVANTEKISKEYVKDYAELDELQKAYPNVYSYFNYNNSTTVNYFNEPNSLDKIYYPTITYDPTKYYVSYTKLLYGETESVTSVYDPTNNQVVLTKTLHGVNSTAIYKIDSDKNYVEIPLYDIGTYHICFDFVVKQYNTNNYDQLITKTFNEEGLINKAEITQIVSENWDVMGDVELSIYGYQLYHTVYKNVNGAGESELTDHTSLFADVTNANITNTANKLNNYKDEDNNNLIISTNQAPLFFKYNGSIVAEGITTQSFYNLYEDYSKNTTLATNVPVESNTRFTENGYYEVCVVYTYNAYKYLDANNKIIAGDEVTKVQTFAFTIENIDPKLTLEKIDANGQKSEFSANGFTNQNVEISWDRNNKFNVLPEVNILAQGFDSDNKEYDITSKYQSQIDNGVVTLTEDNLYTITIKYGPCTYNQQTGKYDYSASVSYSFTIDKQAIQDISATIVSVDNKDQTTYSLQDELSTTSTNQNFIVTYGVQKDEYTRNGKKPSGAKITATYTQLLFSEITENNNFVIEDNGKIYVNNGYEINSCNNNLNYTQITKTEIKGESVIINEISDILTENGIYIFHFVDQAGNTANLTIILDKTKPVLLKKNNDSSYSLLKGTNNIVNTDTEVVWGNFKSISIGKKFENNNSEIIDIIKENENVKVVNGNYYYVIDINQASVSIKNGSPTVVNSTGTIFYADEAEDEAIIYVLNINDKLGNSNDTTYLEMNHDKSLLMAHIKGNAVNNIQTIGKTSTFSSEQIQNQDSSIQRLFPDTTTNRQKIYVDWLENVNTDYEVGSVICEFYPLTFEEDSLNYPYSEQSTQTFDLTKNKTYEVIEDQQRVASAFINLVYDDRYQTNATMPGMYKVVRKYAIAEENFPQGSKDKYERTYYFYVDRQNIISYFNNNILVGGDIQIDMKNSSKTFGGAQFLQEFINDYVLQTNKLPVTINVPTTKYNGDDQKPNSPLTLNFIVENEWTKVYDSKDKTLTNRFIDDGIYTVTIYDNANAMYESESLNIEGSNQLKFKFYINNSSPQVSIINSDNIIVAEDSFNTNKIKIGWKHDTEGYMANIDTNNLTIKKLLPSGVQQVIYKLTNNVVEVGSNYGNSNQIIVAAKSDANWQYEIDLSKFNITDDCKLEITVQYEGNEADYGNKFKTTQTIYFDYSAPEFNYNKLLDNDKYLSSEQKSDFDDVNSAVNFENYAFIIDETFKIDYAPADNFWKTSDGHNVNDTISAWYRKYDKYSNDNDALTMQSIVPTDIRYNDLSQAPQRLRFNENLLDKNGQKYYTEIGNRNIPLYQVVNNQPGYYEIIEKDVAGNYRAYTVAIYPTDSFANALSFGYKNSNNATQPAQWLIDENGNYYSNINNENIQVTDINLYLQSETVGNNWFNVYLTSTKDGVTQTANYTTAPLAVDGLLTIEQLISQINNFISYDTMAAGYSFGMVFNCSNGKTFTINYKTPGGEPTLTFEGSQTNLTVSFVQDPNASIYLTEFYVYEAQNGVPNYNEPLSTDSNGKTIKTNPSTPNVGESAETISYTFRNTSGTGRNLVFVYVDNFDVEYKTFKIIGLTDISYDNMIVIDGVFDKFTKTDSNDIEYYEYYTNQIAKLNYQPAIYYINSIKQTTYLNSQTPETTDLDIESLDSILLPNGTTLLSLYNQKVANSHVMYEISLTDTLGNNYKFIVNYYSKLADLYFMDSSNRLHDMETENVISRALYLTFDKNQFEYETFVSITKSYTNDYGEYFEETFDAQSGLMLSEGANYVITKYNKFGDSYIYNFTIRKSAATHFYSVLVRPDGINLQEIAPSSVKYSYNGLNIEQYFTIYEAIVEVSNTDNLVCEEVEEFDLGNNSYTKVYYIHTDDLANITYEKYIAVTKVNYTRNILTNKFTINENQIVNQKLATVTTDTVEITMPAYNEATGNKVQVQIYYNSQYIGYLQDYVLSADGSTISFELNDSGTYMLYVSDLAGNKHWFNDSDHFTLYVLNNVVYKLNGNYGIANSVFNTNVSLSFDETQTLFTRQNVSGSNYKTFIAITSTLNGKPYTPTRSGENYIYSGYGKFIVRLSGIINNDAENPIVTEVKFSIINPNEAKVAHEYIGLNGYEVTQIVKNGVDITDEIREKLNMLTLNSFAISGGVNSVGGNGHYQITVKVNNNSIKPTQYFSYNIWINSDTNALILCSLEEGGSTTGEIQIQLNLYQIYSKIGECVVKVNGNQFITINESTAAENKVSTYSFTENQRYNVTLETNSGNTLLSFVVTKVEPLNTIAIIVIVVASVVVIGLTITFILLRKKMKIR